MKGKADLCAKRGEFVSFQWPRSVPILPVGRFAQTAMIWELSGLWGYRPRSRIGGS